MNFNLWPNFFLGIEVQLELKGAGNSSAKRKPAGRGKGGSASAEKKSGRGSGTAAKRKRWGDESLKVVVYGGVSCVSKSASVQPFWMFCRWMSEEETYFCNSGLINVSVLDWSFSDRNLRFPDRLGS